MVQLKINTQIKEYPDDITWQVSIKAGIPMKYY